MDIVLGDLKSKVYEKLQAASSVVIAMAYFRPDDEILKILKKIPRLRIVVSDEFDKSDPYRLEEASSESKCIPVFPNRLHAKVIYGEDNRGHVFAFVGSANLTLGGLSSNQEACVMLDSGQGDDKAILGYLSEWLEELYERGDQVDFDEAKKIFDKASQFAYGIGRKSAVTASQHWAIKTRDGREKGALDHWDKFKAEGVIALGWGESLKINPQEVTLDELRAAVQRKYGYGPQKAGRIAKEIRQFAGCDNGLKSNDIVWVIGEFAANQLKPVPIYGVARVAGEFERDRGSNWWKFKRQAEIFPIERALDIEQARKCFGKGAMIETFYTVPSGSFENLCKELHRTHGIVINV